MQDVAGTTAPAYGGVLVALFERIRERRLCFGVGLPGPRQRGCRSRTVRTRGLEFSLCRAQGLLGGANPFDRLVAVLLRTQDDGAGGIGATTCADHTGHNFSAILDGRLGERGRRTKE